MNNDNNFIDEFIKDARLEGSKLGNWLKKMNPRKQILLNLGKRDENSLRKWGEMHFRDDVESFFNALERLSQKENKALNHNGYYPILSLNKEKYEGKHSDFNQSEVLDNQHNFPLTGNTRNWSPSLNNDYHRSSSVDGASFLNMEEMLGCESNNIDRNTTFELLLNYGKDLDLYPHGGKGCSYSNRSYNNNPNLNENTDQQQNNNTNTNNVLHSEDKRNDKEEMDIDDEEEDEDEKSTDPHQHDMDGDNIDMNEKAMDILCICGSKLEQTTLANCYNSAQNVECNKCDKKIEGSNIIIYHCIRENQQKVADHEYGYDLCADCAQTMIYKIEKIRYPTIHPKKMKPSKYYQSLVDSEFLKYQLGECHEKYMERMTNINNGLCEGYCIRGTDNKATIYGIVYYEINETFSDVMNIEILTENDKHLDAIRYLLSKTMAEICEYFKLSHLNCKVAKLDKPRRNMLQNLCFSFDEQIPSVSQYKKSEIRMKAILMNEEIMNEINPGNENKIDIIEYKYWISQDDFELKSTLFDGI